LSSDLFVYLTNLAVAKSMQHCSITKGTAVESNSSLQLLVIQLEIKVFHIGFIYV